MLGPLPPCSIDTARWDSTGYLHAPIARMRAVRSCQRDCRLRAARRAPALVLVGVSRLERLRSAHYRDHATPEPSHRDSRQTDRCERHVHVPGTCHSSGRAIACGQACDWCRRIQDEQVAENTACNPARYTITPRPGARLVAFVTSAGMLQARRGARPGFARLSDILRHPQRLVKKRIRTRRVGVPDRHILYW
jgi:hypothetical protein